MTRQTGETVTSHTLTYSTPVCVVWERRGSDLLYLCCRQRHSRIPHSIYRLKTVRWEKRWFRSTTFLRMPLADERQRTRPYKTSNQKGFTCTADTIFEDTDHFIPNHLSIMHLLISICMQWLAARLSHLRASLLLWCGVLWWMQQLTQKMAHTSFSTASWSRRLLVWFLCCCYL